MAKSKLSIGSQRTPEPALDSLADRKKAAKAESAKAKKTKPKG